MKYLLLTLALTPMLALATAPQKREFRPLLPNSIIKKEETNKLPKWEEGDKREPDAGLFPTPSFD
tara:strand:+ start:269 stop:463 length:195 start_codon:yes stop_codon:yes gene_type:complete